MPMGKKLVAELIGTAWLVFGGCGSAVLAAAFTTGAPGNLHLGIGFTGVAIAFGLTLLTMVYTIGPISGCHINPAITVAMLVVRRITPAKAAGYIAAQLLGAALAGLAAWPEGMDGAEGPLPQCTRWSGGSSVGFGSIGGNCPLRLRAARSATRGWRRW